MPGSPDLRGQAAVHHRVRSWGLRYRCGQAVRPLQTLRWGERDRGLGPVADPAAEYLARRRLGAGQIRACGELRVCLAVVVSDSVRSDNKAQSGASLGALRARTVRSARGSAGRGLALISLGERLPRSVGRSTLPGRRRRRSDARSRRDALPKGHRSRTRPRRTRPWLLRPHPDFSSSLMSRSKDRFSVNEPSLPSDKVERQSFFHL